MLLHGKIRIIGLLSGFLVFSGCMGSMQVKREGSAHYKVPFNRAWEAALQAVQDMEFTVTNTQRDQIGLPAFKKWSGTITAEGRKNMLLQVHPPQLIITVRDSGESIRVVCRAVQDKQMIDYGISTRNKNRFFELFNQHLKR